MIEYRYLTEEDHSIIEEFSRKVNHSPKIVRFIADKISDNKTFKLTGEFNNGYLNGLMIGISIGSFCNTNEFLPIWLGIRIDRIETISSFKTFMINVTKLIITHFSSMDYYNFYIIRRIPKHVTNITDMVRSINNSYTFVSYSLFVDGIANNELEFNNLPKLFRDMIGNFTEPVVIILCNMNNTHRFKDINI